MGRTVLAIVLVAAIGAALIWDWDGALFQIYGLDGFVAASEARAFTRGALPDEGSPVWPAVASLAFRFGDDGVHALRWVATLALGAYAAMWAVFARIAYRSIGTLAVPEVERTQLGLEQLLFGAITVLGLSPGIALTFWDGTDQALFGAVVAGVLALSTSPADGGFSHASETNTPRWRSVTLGGLFALAVAIRPDALALPLAFAAQRVQDRFLTQPNQRPAVGASTAGLALTVAPAVAVACGAAIWRGNPHPWPAFDPSLAIAIGVALAWATYAPRLAPGANAFLPRTRQWLVETRGFAVFWAAYPHHAAPGMLNPVLALVLCPTALLLLIDATVHLVRAQPERPLRSVLRPLRTTALLPLLALAGWTAPAALHVEAGRHWQALVEVGRWLRDATPSSSVTFADDAPVLAYIAQRDVRPWPLNTAGEASTGAESQVSTPTPASHAVYALVVASGPAADDEAMAATAAARAGVEPPLRIVAAEVGRSAKLFELARTSP
jgi:hypothetical protein